MGYKTTDGGLQIVSQYPTEGTRKTVITPNWCDPTTWYFNSLRISSASADVVESGSDYSLTGTIIDTYHGKITGEDNILDADGYSYRPEVFVDGVQKIESDPHYGSGSGDYWIDYLNATIHFNQQISLSASVVVNHHCENGSLFIFKPTDGKNLKIKDVEVQFSKHIGLTDTVVFQAFGYAKVFAPYLLNAPYNYPEATKIPINTTKYKSMVDYVNEANGAMPEVPAMGGPGWRSMEDDIQIFPWNYQAMTNLESAKGMEVHIFLEHETPYSGSVATATFYCFSETE